MKEEVVNGYYDEKKQEYSRKMKIYEKEISNMKGPRTSNIFTDLRPRFNTLLSQNELQSLFDTCYQRTRYDLQQKEKGISVDSGQSSIKPSEMFKAARTVTQAAIKWKNVSAQAHETSAGEGQ